jgi:DNA-binding transcriptional ArsR family regulator
MEERDEPKPPVPDEVPTISVKELKAMAHPVRQRIEQALGRRGHARAADLAADLGLPANQISFHLRVLADAGMIEEAPQHARDKRDRVWTRSKAKWQLGSPDRPLEDERLGGIVMQQVAADLQDVLRRAVAWAPEYSTGRSNEVHGTITTSSIWLTPEEWEQMMTRIHEVMDEYAHRYEPGAPEARRWQLGIIGADDEI